MQSTIVDLSTWRHASAEVVRPPPPAVRARTADFDDFYGREFATMVALAHTICGDRALGEDLAQEALAKAHQKWSTISGYDKPGAWLRRVTINLALSRRRRLAREVVGLARSRPEPTEPLATEIDGDAEVWEAVAKLPSKQRATVALFYQEDLSTGEIAEILGCTVSTATSHLSEARRRLARLLDEELDHEEADNDTR